MTKPNNKRNITPSDVKIFTAWVNTLISDGYNLYKLANIYEEKCNEIKTNPEVKRDLERVWG